MSSAERHRPLLLTVLDGWGYSESDHYNAIKSARTPVWDRLWSEYSHTLLRCSGAEVGLPSGQMGNSEVGHLNLGAGRVVYQEFTRVSRAIKTGSFFSNATLTEAVDKAIADDKAVHILGLLSPGGVHSHEEHIHAMARLALERGAKGVYLHAFLDGRDTPPKSAAESIQAMENIFAELGGGRIASIIGRFYAMDRDHRWPRIQAAYDLITGCNSDYVAPDAMSGLEMAYERGESDEFVKATLIRPEGGEKVCVEDGDVVIFMNYRSDRARQITRPFVEEGFDSFERANKPELGMFVSLTEYSADYTIPVAFPPERLVNVFGAVLANLGMHQLRIAETEKYAHVTFFFNGGREEPFEGEDRILVPSPQVSTYDQQPEMNAGEVTDKLIEAIESDRYDVIICNYANPDMVGHSGDFDATVKAIETLDRCLERLVKAMVKKDGEMLITADHGNAEQMRGEDTGQAHTAHTSNPVPFIYVGEREFTLEDSGTLADVAPTMLFLLGLKQPNEMNGHSIIHPCDEEEE
ncbi:MAG: 2,3-bisphosphoglycerate-independent phosphoglycerate mutase [Gammaproteobacteria bacterium]|nr:2,3-bisphosphoglycerate-independent phosphoglycerate mutase [Gammaproteobacteria bacterium]MCW8841447.1 2,3-bisphosphoglycerate-independent phosphoglycerate mutase [Gammaproteobacteria bacterium]MCW8958640.1 2,3-bisphosphoglycerate-independent phosphoglycerate mutase [Gammaproteobacteria bacterium]MCW8971984.1 2,3-bisphosphoglycerate-independent phosphoglycerate mutase [Gammaproteobacteria bacterium]MCW8991975.1 2,3-bisphosphoglycerate-independent phosphoglycerate mutase [Gammaproteobacteria